MINSVTVPNSELLAAIIRTGRYLLEVQLVNSIFFGRSLPCVGSIHRIYKQSDCIRRPDEINEPVTEK